MKFYRSHILVSVDPACLARHPSPGKIAKPYFSASLWPPVNDQDTDANQKAISLGGRVQTMRSLADTLRTLISLEREAFGLDNMPEPPANDLATRSDEDLAARISELLHVVGA